MPGAVQGIVVGRSRRDTGASGAPSVGASETRLPNGGIKTWGGTTEVPGALQGIVVGGQVSGEVPSNHRGRQESRRAENT